MGIDKTDLEMGTDFTPRWDARGLVQVVTTDSETGALLMVAHMNEQALAETLRTGEAHYWSRSRQSLWRKGETSGNIQHIVEIRVDCDQDALWLKVRADGPACHTGRRSCFYRRLNGRMLDMLDDGA